MARPEDPRPEEPARPPRVRVGFRLRVLGFAANMRVHGKYVVPLDMCVARDFQHLMRFALQAQRLVFEHRELNTSPAADQLHSILPAISDKVPAAHAQCARTECPAGRHGVLGRIVPGLSRSKARDLDDVPGQVLEQVKTVAGQVGKVAATGNGRVGTPVGGAGIFGGRRLAQGPGQVA